jgi:hypothetical protein
MQTTLGMERTLPGSLSVSATYVHSNSVHGLRSRNINAPLPGTTRRPAPLMGEVFQYESSGRSRQNQLVVNVTHRPSKNLSHYVTYIHNRAFSDSEGPDSFPANSHNLAAEWSRSLQDIRHTFYWGGWFTGPLNFEITPTVIVRSGAPFNITTGLDLNGDTQYTERPAFAQSQSGSNVVSTRFGAFNLNPSAGQAIIPRNFGRGPGFVTTHLRVGRTFNLSPASSSAARHNYLLTLAVQVQNLFNHTNAAVPAGNLSSPFFGRSYASVGDFGFGSNAAGNRRIEVQIYFGF